MQSRVLGRLSIISILGLGLWACSSSTTEGGGTGGSGKGGATQGSGGSGTGGSGTGGAGSGGSGSGGAPGTGGKGSGGAVGSGGSTTDSGGKTGTGGTAGAGQGGGDGSGGSAGGRTGTIGRDGGPGSPDGRQGSGGGTGTGGGSTVGGSTGTAGTGGGGSTGTGDCVKGETKGNNVAVLGESFIAMSHGLTKELEALATAAGSLKSGEHYVDKSVSGTWMTQGGDSIPNQYKKAQDANDIKYVVHDGGGNDCMNGGNGDNIITAATAMYKQMATDGVLKAVYFWMPDPIGNNYTNLKSCLDTTRPKLKSFCESQTSPKCYFVDLKESWDGHKDYTSDGIHPTAAGDKASAKQIWEAMVKGCVAQ